MDRVLAYDPHCDEDALNRAYVYAMRAHGGQTRKSGDPYFTHPLAVAAILTELKADPETIITALLHDTVEDTEATLEEVEGLFGPQVAALVDGVTKLSQLEMTAEASKQAENFRKFVLAMSKDVRVLLVKLADRLHNMRTLHHITKTEKRERIAMETMQIYAPLAGRIGVQRFRDELEDLSFKFLNPEGYSTIAGALERLKKDTVHSVVQLSQVIRDKLSKAGIDAEIHSREKRPFSIWRKMQRKNQGFEELADIYAFRILVDDVDSCYRALGFIHRHFNMIPGEFDDYISTPKPNNYQSIHTAVLAPVDNSGLRQRVEIQIRTRDMHESAERGIAAHWRYKDAAATGSRQHGEIEITQTGRLDPYEWARSAVEMMQSGQSADEFLETAKLDLFHDQVFCFTPKGRVIALPTGATGIDFAYALHTDIGDSCVGVQINGVAKPLRTPLKNGDIIRVHRAEDAPIPQDWESLVTTGRAKAAIRRRIKALREREQVKLGQRLVEAEFDANGLSAGRKAIRDALRKNGYRKADDVYRAVGALELSAAAVLDAVYPGVGGPGAKKKARTSAQPVSRKAIPIAGLTPGGSFHLSGCCSPLPGERIVGVPGADGAVAVHRIDCEALALHENESERWLDLRWRDDTQTDFVAPIIITVNNRIGALAHVADILSRYEADITDIRLRNRGVKFHDVLVDVLVRDIRHLSNVLTALRASDTVIDASRREEKGPVKMPESGKEE